MTMSFLMKDWILRMVLFPVINLDLYLQGTREMRLFWKVMYEANFDYGQSLQKINYWNIKSLTAISTTETKI